MVGRCHSYFWNNLFSTIFILKSTSNKIDVEHFALDEFAQSDAHMHFRPFFRQATRTWMINNNE